MSFCLLGFCMRPLCGSYYLITPKALFQKPRISQGFFIFFCSPEKFFKSTLKYSCSSCCQLFPPSFHLCTYAEIQEASHINTQGPEASEKPPGDTKHQEHSTGGTLAGPLESETLRVPLVSLAICCHCKPKKRLHLVLPDSWQTPHPPPQPFSALMHCEYNLLHSLLT